MGYKSNQVILKTYEKSSLAVACSRWDEPFGRSSLEASSRGCAVIISNKGGLPETITDGIILNKLSVNEIYKNIKNLLVNQNKLKEIQLKSYKNFYLDNKFISKKIDRYRSNFFNKTTEYQT
jgi:glycosyltransferase involved in cell wall biosynthesis